MQATRHNVTIQVAFPPLAETRNEWVTNGGLIVESILLDDDIAVLPRFTSVRRHAMIGSEDLLTFYLSIPIAFAIDLAAHVVYDWLKKHGARRLKVESLTVDMNDVNALDRIRSALEQSVREPKA